MEIFAHFAANDGRAAKIETAHTYYVINVCLCVQACCPQKFKTRDIHLTRLGAKNYIARNISHFYSNTLNDGHWNIETYTLHK